MNVNLNVNMVTALLEWTDNNSQNLNMEMKKIQKAMGRLILSILQDVQ